MSKFNSERNMKIIMDTITKERYYFDNIQLLGDFQVFVTGCGGVEDAYQQIAEKTGYAWGTTKNHIMYGRMPDNLDTIKKYGSVIAGNEYAYLMPISRREETQEAARQDAATGLAAHGCKNAEPAVRADETEKYTPRIKEIFRMLYEVLSLVEDSEYYNYKPGTEDLNGAWEYFDRMMTEIRKETSALFLGERDSEVYQKLSKIIDETDTYIKSFSVPGVVPRWREINREINYYDVVFDAIEEYSFEEVQKWQSLKNSLTFPYFPTEEDIVQRKRYFEEKDEKNNKNNLHYSRDRYFQDELLVTLEKVFEHDFWKKEKA